MITGAASILQSATKEDDVLFVVVSSPQELAKAEWTRPCIDVTIECGTLSGVVIDKVQLFVEFGAHFCPEFLALKRVLFNKLRVEDRDVSGHTHNVLKAPVILTTATFNDDCLMAVFTKMTGLRIPPPTWIWATPSEMARREINLRFIFSNDFSRHAKTFLVNLLGDPDATDVENATNSDNISGDNDADSDANKELQTNVTLAFRKRNPNTRCIMYTNSLALCDSFRNKFNEWLDDTKAFHGDILSLTGNLFSEQKSDCANVFAEAIDLHHAIENNLPCPRLFMVSAGMIGAAYDNPFI